MRDRAVKAQLARQNRAACAASTAARPPRAAANDPKMLKVLDAVQWQADHFEDIPVIVVACLRGRPAARLPADGRRPRYYGSIYPSVQNLLLAARAAGLGAALITLPLWSTFRARRILGCPWNVQPCAVIPLGWPIGPLRADDAAAGRGGRVARPLRQPRRGRGR